MYMYESPSPFQSFFMGGDSDDDDITLKNDFLYLLKNKQNTKICKSTVGLDYSFSDIVCVLLQLNW